MFATDTFPVLKSIYLFILLLGQEENVGKTQNHQHLDIKRGGGETVSSSFWGFLAEFSQLDDL